MSPILAALILLQSHAQGRQSSMPTTALSRRRSAVVLPWAPKATATVPHQPTACELTTLEIHRPTKSVRASNAWLIIEPVTQVFRSPHDTAPKSVAAASPTATPAACLCDANFANTFLYPVQARIRLQFHQIVKSEPCYYNVHSIMSVSLTGAVGMSVRALPHHSGSRSSSPDPHMRGVTLAYVAYRAQCSCRCFNFSGFLDQQTPGFTFTYFAVRLQPRIPPVRIRQISSAPLRKPRCKAGAHRCVNGRASIRRPRATFIGYKRCYHADR